MLKRFWLFVGEEHYPSGGMSDFKDCFDTLAEAMAAPLYYVEWAHIFDSQTGRVVAVLNADAPGFWAREETDMDAQFSNVHFCVEN